MSREPGLPLPPPTAIRDVQNEILVKASAAGELVPKKKWPSPFLRKIGTCFSVVTKIRENVPNKANDLMLVSRDPQ